MNWATDVCEIYYVTQIKIMSLFLNHESTPAYHIEDYVFDFKVKLDSP
jgi:hypothetical protein